jgi:hypothetical protein
VTTEQRAQQILNRDPAAHIAAFEDDLRAGRPWTEALLATIAAWDTPFETVDGREFRYLLGDEAFDWLVLAERLTDAVMPRLLPESEVEDLLLEERWPHPMTEERFQESLGPVKYRAHLNFLYGVRVEEALQLLVEEQVRKERGNAAFGRDTVHNDDAFHRTYGAGRATLLRDFRLATNRPMLDRIGLSELKEFTYWLFKRRIAVQDPARVASDTRRGLQRLQAMEELKRRRRVLPAREDVADSIIDAIAQPVS